MKAATLQQAVLSLGWLLVIDPWLGVLLPRHATTEAKDIAAPKRYTFKIEPKTPLSTLLPTPPELPPALPPWRVWDLSQTPEVLFQKPERDPVARQLFNMERMRSEEQEVLLRKLGEARDKAEERAAHLIARINHLNKEGTDHFLKTLLKARPDLAGLPFAMGDDCRTDQKASQQFVKEVSHVNFAQSRNSKTPLIVLTDPREGAKYFWGNYERGPGEPPAPERTGVSHRMRIAALMQMLAPHSRDHRLGLVKHLADLPGATAALTQLAIFSQEEEVRDAALAALKERRAQVDAGTLLRGVRYPWPEVAQNAAKAIVTLDRGDLIGDMLTILDEPDARAPVQRDGKHTVRELVRINHHRNCLLCHAPGNTPDMNLNALGLQEDIVTAPAPNPNQQLPSPLEGYGFEASPDTFVRVDVNYLRQDFSIMQPVKDADPWPLMQRFDFLVRTREITSEEAGQYETWRVKQGPDYLPPNQDAALIVLRGLTRRDAGRSAAAWRRELGL